MLVERPTKKDKFRKFKNYSLSRAGLSDYSEVLVSRWRWRKRKLKSTSKTLKFGKNNLINPWIQSKPMLPSAGGDPLLDKQKWEEDMEKESATMKMVQSMRDNGFMITITGREYILVQLESYSMENGS